MRQMPPHVKLDPFYARNWNNVHFKDKNVLAILTGGTGDCKSGSAITIGNDLDIAVNGRRRFSLDNVVFGPQEFLSKVQSNLPKGTVIIWDEIGVGHDAREYFDLRNRLVNKIMRTFRYRNFILLMTTPTLPDLDVGTRRLLHVVIEMKGKVNDNYAAAKIKWVTTSSLSGKNYYKFPRFNKEGHRMVMERYYIRKPPKELEDAYKVKKEIETKKWYKDFEGQLNYMREIVDGKNKANAEAFLSLEDAQKLVIKNANSVFDFKKNRFNPVLIESNIIGIGRRLSERVARLMNLRIDKGELVAPTE